MDKQTDGQTNGQKTEKWTKKQTNQKMELHQFQKEPSSVGIEMQFEYRYQTLFWLCISIDIEISFHAVKSVILHLLILQLSKLFY